MHVELHPDYANNAAAKKAAELTTACVHCGFCLPTCPTYVEQRDERDSPRGRIYLIKHLLESGEAGSETQLHLDRCLTCRNCETACPSGMQYGQLLDIGRELVEQQAPRPLLDSASRRLLRFLFVRPRLLATGLTLGRLVRPFVPASLRAKIPESSPTSARIPGAGTSTRNMLLLEGCVQQAATPGTNAAARRVMTKLGIELIAAPQAGCCGALDYHLSAHEAGLQQMRRNIDAWWPHIEAGAEAIISSASGCGAMLIDYGRLLVDDPEYADKAQRVSQLSHDLGEVLWQEDLTRLTIDTDIGKIAVHTPCTLQHALQQPDLINDILAKAGFELTDLSERVLCCGSAGSYSILQPKLSESVRATALTTLTEHNPALIATANIGCQLHLQGAAGVPVRHWIELLDQG